MIENLTPNKELSIKQFIPGIAWFFIVLILICMPGKNVPKVDWLDIMDIDKLIHCGIFGMMVVLFCYPFKKTTDTRSQKINWFIKIALSTCIWGLATEFIQKYFIPGRFFDIIDWVADSLGVLLAYFFCKKFFV